MPIYQKITEVMRRVGGVEKSGYNQHGRYNYAGHEALTVALRGHFAALGIVRTASMTDCQVLDGGHIKCACVVTYVDSEDGSFAEFPMVGIAHCQTKAGNVTAQQVGAALSFAVKNVEFKLFALTGDPDAEPFESGPQEAASAPSSGEQPSADNIAKARAHELLAEYETAATLEEVKAITSKFQAEWDTLSSVPNLSEAMVASRRNAHVRIKGGAR